MVEELCGIPFFAGAPVECKKFHSCPLSGW
jgi:hypothetical protein